MESILVSACLLGEAVRYDGGDKLCQGSALQRWQEEGRLVAVCPEVAGGLSVPREPAEIVAAAGGEKVIAGEAWVYDRSGRDVSDQFLAGARRALDLARQRNIRLAILKENSPSCGSSSIHAGDFSGSKVAGAGVTTAMLRAAGVTVFSENELMEAEAFLRSIEAEA